MNHRMLAAACCIVGTALGAPAAWAQDVHKCTVGGQVQYQARPCAGSDVVVQTPATPSAQEMRDANDDLRRQRWEAATGRLLPRPPQRVAPPSFQQQPQTASTTTTTTTIIVNSATSHSVIHSTTRTVQPGTSSQSLALPPPRNNCEKLNRDNDEALSRRDELSAPSELASRQQRLADVQAQLTRIREWRRRATAASRAERPAGVARIARAMDNPIPCGAIEGSRGDGCGPGWPAAWPRRRSRRTRRTSTSASTTAT